jgi:hypothetical protein
VVPFIASEAYATAVKETALVAAFFVFLGLLATLKLPPGRPREDIADLPTTDGLMA